LLLNYVCTWEFTDKNNGAILANGDMRQCSVCGVTSSCHSWSPIRVRRMDDNLNDPVTIEAMRAIELNAIGV
jgi:hypothetical protein